MVKSSTVLGNRQQKWKCGRLALANRHERRYSQGDAGGTSGIISYTPFSIPTRAELGVRGAGVL